MSEKLTQVSNTSYVSRDFQKIWPELLDLVKQLTTKWDPSLSDESDPGVVLLKLNALLGDKLNYAIDKNTLECFPLSVTQLRNARQMYNQLGYKMRWYNAATTNISMSWVDNVVEGHCTIPAFTMISNPDGDVVYTLLGPQETSSTGNFVIKAQDYYFDHTTLAYRAIQGIALNYLINGETTITSANLDSNNRLYFETTDVAQNGIFITNVDQNNYTEWEQKDNLLVEQLNNKYYTFGVSLDTTACYIEFPEDAENIIRDGIQITYIKTQGGKGNIPANYLTKFISDLTVTNSSTGEAMSLTTDNTKIINYDSATNGTNPESIDSAYRNYQHLVGTFNTLTTLRDYINYILENNLASNGFVTDRTCDPQSCYGVISNIDGVSLSQTMVDKWIDKETTISVYNDQGQKSGTGHPENPCLTAYNIKFYLFNYVTDFSSYENYHKSFAIMSEELMKNVQSYIEDCRSISHDYTGILDSTQERSNICFLKNMYPVVCKVVTKYSLTTVQAEEVLKNIVENLYSSLNSQQVNFREAISTEDIVNAIVDADERIKTAYVDNIEYTTYAVIKESTDTYSEVCVSDTVADENKLDITIYYDENYRYDPSRMYNVNDICIYKTEGKDVRYKCIERTATSGEPFTSRRWEALPVLVPTTRPDDYGSFYRKFVDALGFSNFAAYQTLTFKYIDNKWSQDTVNTSTESLGFYTYVYRGNVATEEDLPTTNTNLGDVYRVGTDTEYAYCWRFKTTTDETTAHWYYLTWDDVDLMETATSIQTIKSIVVNVKKSEQCKDEIFTKSVLSGVTPLYVNDELVDFKFCQVRNFDETVDPINIGINKIVTEVDINVERSTTSEANMGEYSMRQNESIQLFSPNYINSSSYSNMVKYEYYITNDVSENSIYELRQNEYIVFYWKVDGDESEYYSYHVYGQGCVFKPSFNMSKQTTPLECQSVEYGLDFTKLRNTGSDDHPSWEMDSTNDGAMTSGLNSAVSQAAFAKSNHLLSGTKKITMQKINQITLGSAVKCYWMTNVTSASGLDYVLHFDDNEKRTLDPGEYFIYSNTSLTTIVIFGAGTTLTRKNYPRTGIADLDDWRCTKLDLDQVLENGTAYISKAQDGGWKVIPQGISIEAVENKYTTLGSGSSIKLEPKLKNQVTKWNVKFTRDGYEAYNTTDPENPQEMTLADFIIYYKLSSEEDYKKLDAVDSMSTSGWSARSLLGLSVSPDEEQILYQGQKITMFFKDQDATTTISGSGLSTDILYSTATWDGTYPISPLTYNSCTLISTDAPKSIDYIDDASFFMYITGELAQYVLLVKGTTLFQDEDHPEILHCRPEGEETQDYVMFVTQDIVEPGLTLSKGTYFYKGGQIFTCKATWKTDTRNYYPVCLLSTESLSFDGGGEYLPAYLDENLEYVYPAIYISSRNVSTKDNLVRYLLDGAVAFTFGENESNVVTELTIKTYLPVGEYIIEFSNSGSQVFLNLPGELKVIVDKGTADEICLHTMYNEQDTNFKNTSNTFLYWNNEVDMNHTFTVTVPYCSENTLVILENPYKYDKPDIIDYFEFEKYKTLVKNFDINGTFNYTFQVDEDSRIENPLKANNFLNTNHPYNSVLICEANKLSSSNIHILDKNV